MLKNLYLRYINHKKNKLHKAYITEPCEIQNKLLNEIISSYKGSDFYLEQNLEKITDLSELKKRKVTDHTDISKYSQNIKDKNRKKILTNYKIKYLAKSGGSTGVHKYLPYTKGLIKKFQEFQLLATAQICEELNDYSILDRNILVNPASVVTEENENVCIGMATGIMTKLAPKFARKGIFPSIETINIKNNEEKINNIGNEVIGKDVRAFSSTPSFAIPILNHLYTRTSAKSIREIWPNFKIYIWSGSPLRNYEAQIKNLIGDIPTFEIYSSTESAVAYQYKKKGELIVSLTTGVFLFQKAHSNLDSQKYDVSELKIGEKYRILFTTYGGLINYNIGDVIEVLDNKPLIIRVIGRDKEDVIIGGAERISLDEIYDYLNEASRKNNLNINNFMLAPYENENQIKGYDWYIEFSEGPNSDVAKKFLNDLEISMLQGSHNYLYMRTGNLRLLPPILNILQKDAIDSYLQNKKVFAQGKVLRVYNDLKDCYDIKDFFQQKNKINEKLRF